MNTPPGPRDRQRGNSMVLALIVLSALATLGSLTVVSVQSSLRASTNDRSQAVAMFAAESGGALAIQYLRNNFDPGTPPGTYWSAFVEANNAPPFEMTSAQIPSEGILPGVTGNVFTADQRAWYELVVLNNRGDPSLAAGDDADGQIIIRSTGHGPQGALAIIEWEIARAVPTGGAAPPPPSLATVVPADPVIILGWRVVL
jgi:hypothetical protein